MLPELYRSFETGTLLDLVSYGDPEYEEPEESVHPEDEAPARPETLTQRRGGWLVLGRKRARWLRLGRRWIDRVARR
jgi:hypothetical protein